MARKIDITVEWSDPENIQKYLVNLPKQTTTGLKSLREQFAAFVQKSAKLRVQRGWTGYLASTIRVQAMTDSIIVSVGARYGYFVETGAHPRVIPIEYLEQHMAYPSRPGVDTRLLGFRPRAWVFPKAAKPFMAPAFEAAIAKLPEMMMRTVDQL